jgi:hypothetical protein
MPLLSIIGCESFKKEIAQVLLKGGAIDSLAIVNGKDASFEKALKGIGARVRMVSADSIPADLQKSKGFNVILTMQSVSPNSNSCKLSREIYEKIRFYGNISDGVLLLYGHCDSELEDILSDLSGSRFCLKAVSKCSGISPGAGMPLCSRDKADKRSIDPEILSVYEKLYADIKMELGMPDRSV